MMQEDIFIKNNAEVWSSLESRLKTFTRKMSKRMHTKEEIDELIVLYNQVMNHLVFSRTNYGNNDTTEYLNKLAASAHAVIYSSPRLKATSLLSFFMTGFPRLFRKNIKFFIVSALIFSLSAGLLYVLTAINPENSYAFLPPQYTENIRDESMGTPVVDGVLDSSFITTNNIRVSFNAFALGITLGIGTVYTLFFNGVILGALGGIAYVKGQSAFFWSLILPHGVPELFAIFVCGAAGLILGYSLINPGKISRKDALITRGKEAVKLVMGCVPILIVAGIIEGYFTPLPIPYVYKFLFAFAALVLLAVYLIFPGTNFSRKIFLRKKEENF